MADYQRILVVSDATTESAVRKVRDGLGHQVLVLAAPTPEAARVVAQLGARPRVELLLAPERFPHVDRGHRLDELVRNHALHDRFRTVVVVLDTASATLLLRVLAPDQLPTAGSVTVVGLPRGERPVATGRATVTGLVIGATAVVGQLGVTSALIGIVALVGAVGMLSPVRRHLGRELLLAAVIAVAAGILVVAGSARFPAGW